MSTPDKTKRGKAGRKARAPEETMTRRQLADAVYERIYAQTTARNETRDAYTATGRKRRPARRITAQEVFDVITETIDVLQTAILSGKHIEFRKFGVFEVIVRKSRIGRNPNDPSHTVVIPSRRTVKFKPSKELLAALSGLQK